MDCKGFNDSQKHLSFDEDHKKPRAAASLLSFSKSVNVSSNLRSRQNSKVEEIETLNQISMFEDKNSVSHNEARLIKQKKAIKEFRKFYYAENKSTHVRNEGNALVLE